MVRKGRPEGAYVYTLESIIAGQKVKPGTMTAAIAQITAEQNEKRAAATMKLKSRSRQ